MDSPNRYLLWIGVALILWVAYQSVTGKFIYKRASARREEHPLTFWSVLAFEGVGAIACLGYGLGLETMATACAALMELMALSMGVWVLIQAVRRAVKYPFRIFLHLGDNRPQTAISELQAYLARRPEDRETLYLLAGAHEQAGERAIAMNIYTELSHINDVWGRGAKSFLRKHTSETSEITRG